MKMLLDHVLLRPVVERSEGGILIPDAYQDDVANKQRFIHDSNQFVKAEVMAVYRRRWTKKGVAIEPDVKVGDYVVYRRAEAVADHDLIDPKTGDVLVMVHEESCLGVVDPDTKVERVVSSTGDRF